VHVEKLPVSRIRKTPLSVIFEGMTIAPSTKSQGEEMTESELLDLMDWNDPEERVALPMFSPKLRNDQNELVRTIGARMKEAREMLNMSQLEAAQRLGYANSSKLAKIEHASDTNSIPLTVVQRAAQLYDVSVDFLFGLSEDWEPGVRRETSSFLLRAWEESRRRDMESLNRLYRRVQAVAGVIDEMVSGSNEVAAALRSVRERGGEFDELPAGNRLLCAIERQTETARQAEGGLRRFRAELLGKIAPEG